jgi:hypothetical protein
MYAVMKSTNKSLGTIKREITRHKKSLNELHSVRQAVRGYTTVPLAEREAEAGELRAMLRRRRSVFSLLKKRR